MPATVIPVKGLYLGFIGNISNEGYSLRTARPVNSTDTNSIAFGETFVLNANNTYSSLKTYLQAGGSIVGLTAVGTTALPLGIAASNVNINPSYPIGGSFDALTPGGVYLPGAIMDGLVQGTINVSCNNGTPTAGAIVYIRTAINSALPAGIVGGLEAVADPNPASTTGTASSGSTALTVASATGITQGMAITGVGLPAGVTVAAITGTSVTLSAATTAALSTTAIVFTSNVPYDNFRWKTGFKEVDNTTQVTILSRKIA